MRASPGTHSEEEEAEPSLEKNQCQRPGMTRTDGWVPGEGNNRHLQVLEVMGGDDVKEGGNNRAECP